MIGDIININLFALLGKIDSLTKSLNPSDKGCNKPYTPTTFGPLRLCIAPNIFLSAKVKYATEINKGTIIIKIFIKDINRARVIQAKSIMTPTNSKSTGPVVQENMALEDILQIMSESPSKPVTIKDTKGKITGKIEIANLIEGMKRPKSQGTNITG